MELTDCRRCTEVINHSLLNPRYGKDSSETVGFMVHDSIFDLFSGHLSQHGVILNDECIWDYTLYVGTEFFMMKLIHIQQATTDQRNYLNTLVEYAKVAFFWCSTVTLYTTTEHYHYLKNFVSEKNLKGSIKNTYTTQSISYDHAEIKLVEFDETVNSNIIQEFYDYHKSLPSSVYYVTYALDYLAPKNLLRFDKPYTNPDTLLILYLVLDYHRSLKLKKIREVFNILDLCAMKLAFDDPRYQFENCEFEKLIKTMLNTKKYIKSGVFNMKLYVINKAVFKLPNPSIITYFIANYQSHFDQFDYFVNFEGWGNKQNFIKLADIVDPINLIKFLEHNEMAEIYYIDGTNFTAWNGELFIKLCEKAARRIIIDTTMARWDDYSEIKHSLGFLHDEYVKSLEIVGTNEFNFIENFFNWLKLNPETLPTQYFNVIFSDCQINYPFIFNRLPIGMITFKNVTLTKHLLDNIARCQYYEIMTNCCKLENNVEVIGSLDSIERVHLQLTLQEEGHTLELFMRFVAKRMLGHDLTEFEFRNKIFLITNAFLDFSEYKFIMNEDRTRLDFYHKKTERVVDIYEYRNRKHIGAEEDYDFYG